MCCGCLSMCLLKCCSAACLPCKACCKLQATKSVASRLAYSVFLVCAMLISILLLGNWAEKILNDALQDHFFAGLTSSSRTSVPAHYVGVLAVYRVMTGAVLFHVLLGVLLIGVKNAEDRRYSLQNDWWLGKGLLWIALIVLMFFLPNELFGVLAWVYKIGGCLFILVQLVIMYDFLCNTYHYCMGKYLADPEAEGCHPWAWAALLFTFACYGFCIFIFVMVLVVNSDTAEGCKEGVVAVSVNIALTVIVTLVSASTFVKVDAQGEPLTNAPVGGGTENGAFQAAGVAAYSFYLVGSALLNHPEARCSPFNNNNNNNGWIIVQNATAAEASLYQDSRPFPWFALLGCLGLMIVVSHTVDSSAREIGHEAQLDWATGENGEEELHDDGKDEVTYSFSTFHLIYAIASMYTCMLLTGWDAIEGADSSLKIDRSMGSVWVKLVSSWVCLVLYIVVLLLPPCCPGRVFNNEPKHANNLQP